MSSKDFEHLFEMFLKAREKHPEKKALSYKPIDTYQDFTYEEIYQKIASIALGLKKLGCEESFKGALLCSNRPEWVISDMAILSLKGVTVPIYPTLAPEEIEGILKNSEASVVFLETKEHCDKVLSIYKGLSRLKHVIYMCQTSKELPDSFTSFSDLLHMGEVAKQSKLEEWQDQFKRIKREDTATIVYTSGSTGTFKGVVLSHGNILENVKGFLTFNLILPTDLTLSILPLSHIFERTVGYYSVIAQGASIAYAEDTKKVAQNLKEVQPSIMIAVPRFFEKVQKSLLNNLSGFKKKLFNWALLKGYRYHKARREKRLNAWHTFTYGLAYQLFISKLHKKMGLDRLRHFGCGGAPFAGHILLFFEALGLRIVEGYGLTECSPIIAMNNKDEYKPGTVGKPLPGLEVQLAEDGELLVKGPCVMQGYYQMEEKTQKVLQEGFLHTGDIATFDSEGYIKIIDRKKEILVLSNGKNVAPVPIEKRVAKSSYILQCIVIGDRQNYITALVVPNFPQILKKFRGYSEREVLEQPRVKDFIAQQMRKYTQDLAPFSQIKKFRFLKSELSFEGGELTPTMKIKRKAIEEKHRHMIEEMYAEVNEHIQEKRREENNQANFI